MARLPAGFGAAHFAHRGLHGPQTGAPENSLAAFRHAIEAGYAIELDLRLGAEGEVLVFHDGDLERMTGTAGRIEICPPEIRSGLRLLGTDEGIPTLTETLALVAGRCSVLAEIKIDPADRVSGAAEVAQTLAERVVERVAPCSEHVGVMSLDGATMHRVRALAPEILRGVTYADAAALAEGRVEDPDGDFAAWRADELPAEVVERMRAAGCPIFAWTVTDEDSAARVRPYADALIFEHFHPEFW